MPDGFSVFTNRLIWISEPYKPAQEKAVTLIRVSPNLQNVFQLLPAQRDAYLSTPVNGR